MIYYKNKDNQDRQTINFPKIPSFLYWWYKRKIIKNFNLLPITEVTQDLDVKFQTLKSNNGEAINIEWDTWSGFCIVALNKEAEQLILDILEYMK